MKKLNFVFFSLIAITLGGAQEMRDYGQMEKIKITQGEKEVVFIMDNNASSRDFLALLPVTLILEDYNSIEKVSPLPSRLSTEGSPSGYDPDIGDICLYAPWGNLCIFYRDFGYAGGLVKLGHTVSGAELLNNLEGPVLIQAVK